MHILPCLLNRRAVGAALLAVLFATLGTSTAKAQRLRSDPVEELRRTLKTVTKDFPLRKKELAREIDALKTLGELRRALILQEWRDDDLDDQILNIDQPARALIARRFDLGVKAALGSGNVAMQLAAADMLSDLGVSARAVGTRAGIASAFAPSLIELFQSNNPAVRVAAAHALGEINPDATLAVPALEKLLVSGSPPEQHAAADALTSLVRVGVLLVSKTRTATGVEATRADLVGIAKLAIPVLLKGLAGRNEDVRRSCAQGMVESASALNKQVENRSPDEVTDLAEYRKQVDEERTELMPLIAALRESCEPMARILQTDTDRIVRLRLCNALEDIGHARLLLIRRLMGANIYVPNTPLEENQGNAAPSGENRIVPAVAEQKDAGRIIVQDQVLLPGLLKTFPALRAALTDPDKDIRLQVYDILETLGPEAAPMAPDMVNSLSDRAPFVRWAAARALGKVGPTNPEASVPALLRLTSDQDLDLCLAAAMALERFGPAASGAVAGLIPRLRATDAELRIAIVRTLIGIGVASEPAIPGITALLADPDPRVRQAAADALGRFGKAAAGAVPALENATQDPVLEVRKSASDAILSILPPPPPPR